MSELKLIALDEDDLHVISAHLQDAVVRIGDLAFDNRRQRFAAVLNRFDWAHAGMGDKPAGLLSRRQPRPHRRRRVGLRFERVKSVKALGIDRNKPDAVLSLLAVTFASDEMPEGRVSLIFSGGMEMALEVECLEAELRDLSAAWETSNRPEHALDDADETSLQ